MKNKNKFYILVILLVAISFLALPKDVSATTLKEYEDAVAKYTKELQEKENKIARSKEEVAKVKANIASIEKQMREVEEQIKTLEKEIDESNKKIDEKKEESKRLIKYFQVVNGENSYLEYIFGATSIQDMIYRVSVVEQLTDYNEQVVKELNRLIDENKKKKEELSNKEKELANLKINLEKEKERIEAEISGVEGTIPDTKGQIAFYKNRVSYYKNKGCKSNDVIGVTCDVPKKVTGGGGTGNVSAGAIIGTNGFRFPVDGGGISWGYGGVHKGVDITKNRTCGAPIHPVAAGRVYYVGNTLDTYGAYMVIIVHNLNGRLLFSQYAHVQSNIPVRVGQDVDISSTIAYMGTTGYSTGCHLHLEMALDKGWGYNASYYEYIRHIINPFTYVPRP